MVLKASDFYDALSGVCRERHKDALRLKEFGILFDFGYILIHKAYSKTLFCLYQTGKSEFQKDFTLTRAVKAVQ